MKIEIDLNNKEHVAAIAEALEKASDGGKYWVSVHPHIVAPIQIMFSRGSDITSASASTASEAVENLKAEIREKHAKKITGLKKQLAELEGASAA